MDGQCFGGNVDKVNNWGHLESAENTHNAYMLVYEKTVQMPFKIDL